MEFKMSAALLFEQNHVLNECGFCLAGLWIGVVYYILSASHGNEEVRQKKKKHLWYPVIKKSLKNKHVYLCSVCAYNVLSSELSI